MLTMNTHTIPALSDNAEQLTQAPHVLAQLVDLLDGTFQPTPEQETNIAAHLAICPSCQLFVELVLLALIRDEQERDQPTADARALLTRWSQIAHATLRAKIPAYVEVRKEHGEQVANTRFPLLANHMQTCQACQAEISDLLLWLDLLR
jgi:hypothetical protein